MENKKICPVDYTISLINGKWKVDIMKELSQEPVRYGNLSKSLSCVSAKVLIQTLREMEKDGLVVRTVFPEVPPRVEYSLSEKGRSMYLIFIELRKWGMSMDDLGLTECKGCKKCLLRKL